LFWRNARFKELCLTLAKQLRLAAATRAGEELHGRVVLKGEKLLEAVRAREVVWREHGLAAKRKQD